MVALSTAFCPPVEYFAVLAGYSTVFLDSSENYNKQSWRNRCRILSEAGPLDLIVPVVHGGSRLITDIEVEYTTPWIPKMERAIASAYDSSPFFEFYRDGLFGILESRPATLWELDRQIIDWLCGKIGIQSAEGFAFERRATLGNVRGGDPSKMGGMSSGAANRIEGNPAADEPVLDLRDAIHPKRSNTILKDMGLERPYWQVFRERFGFVGGLSVLDLLFNEGPDSILYLK